MNFKNQFIIYITFLILSVYNYSFDYFRPTETVILFVLLILLVNFNKISKLAIYGTLFITYLLMVLLLTVDGSLIFYGIHNLQIWVYAIVFLALSKLFADLDLEEHKTVILKAVWISLAFLILIFTLNSFGFAPTLALVGETLEDFDKTAIRVPGFSYVVIFFIAVLFYLFKAKKMLYFWFIVGVLVLFYFDATRSTIIAFFLVMMVLHLSYKIIVPLILILMLSYSMLFTFAAQLGNSDNEHAVRVAETIYFYKSVSVYRRYLDIQQTIKQVSDINVWTGASTGLKLNLWRSSINFDYKIGQILIKDATGKRYYNYHCPDNSFLLMYVDGGLILLFFILAVMIKSFITIWRYDPRLAWTFLIIIIIIGFLSKHVISNYVYVFTLGFIYFYAKLDNKKRKEDEIESLANQ